MTGLNYHQLAEIFKGMAHPARLQILDLLREGEMCVCHIEATLQRRQAYVSQQLMTLRDAGLVESRRDGLQVYYRLAHPQIPELLRLMLGTTRGPDVCCVDGCPCPSCSHTNTIQVTESLGSEPSC